MLLAGWWSSQLKLLAINSEVFSTGPLHLNRSDPEEPTENPRGTFFAPDISLVDQWRQLTRPPLLVRLRWLPSHLLERKSHIFLFWRKFKLWRTQSSQQSHAQLLYGRTALYYARNNPTPGWQSIAKELESAGAKQLQYLCDLNFTDKKDVHYLSECRHSKKCARIFRAIGTTDFSST